MRLPSKIVTLQVEIRVGASIVRLFPVTSRGQEDREALDLEWMEKWILIKLIGVFVLKLVSFPLNFVVASTFLDPYITRIFPEFSRIL
jgi:hypothetical protein